MSWEIHEAAERIADGWHSELEETRKRNAVLGRENARLREELTKMDQWHSMELKAAMADNAKLRELVRDMYEMAYPEYPSAFAAAFADRMRELEIEVSNGQEGQTQGEAAR